jgi:phosphatidylglycerol:prolipoprotein diacylglycerol transferase
MFFGIAVSFLLAWRRSGREGILLNDLWIFAACSIAAALLCGYLLYIFITYPFRQILLFLTAGDFRFLQGGLVFYGGLIGAIFACILCAHLLKYPIIRIENAIVPYIPLGHAFGRIGCMLAGCCHGAPYNGPFAIYYRNSVLGVSPSQGYFPVQPLEALLNICICFLLNRYRKKRRKPFDLLFAYLSLYATTRFLLEFYRGDSLRGFTGGFSTSQWISLGLLFTALLRYAINKIMYKDYAAHFNTPN